MTIILISLAALLVLGIITYLAFGRRSTGEPLQQAHPEGCCGQHAVCEKDSLLSALQKDIEYFADEELDRFRCTPAENYSEEEEEEFRAVLTTMREDEVPAWVRSLQLRGIEIPAGLRDEVLLIVGDLRSEV